jgi:hypothetical protein
LEGPCECGIEPPGSRSHELVREHCELVENGKDEMIRENNKYRKFRKEEEASKQYPA